MNVEVECVGRNQDLIIKKFKKLNINIIIKDIFKFPYAEYTKHLNKSVIFLIEYDPNTDTLNLPGKSYITPATKLTAQNNTIR